MLNNNNTIGLKPNLQLNFQVQYGLIELQMNELYKNIENPSFIEGLTGLFKDNPYNYIISMRAYPFNVSSLYNDNDREVIKISSYTTNTEGIRLGTIKNAVKLGSYTFIPYFSNFLDKNPYTKINVYLPYIGYTHLNADEVMGHKISFWYAIDTYSGNATCLIQNDDKNYIIQTMTNKIGIDITFGGTNATEKMSNLFMTGASVVGGIVTGGMGGAISTLTNAPSIINGLKENVTRGSVGDGFSGLVGMQNVTIIIERPEVSTSEQFKPFRGKPLMQTRVLNTLTGYTEVEEIHIENIPIATKQELEEIENLLKSGVIL